MAKQKWFPVSGFVSRMGSVLVSGLLASCLFVSCLVVLLLLPATAFAQSKSYPSDKFKQMDDLLPTPNEQRTASGAPGRGYWQQRADYDIKVEIDDLKQRLSASETITYYNNSPDPLRFLTDFRDEIKAVVKGVNIAGMENTERVRQVAQAKVDELFSLMKPPSID